MADNFKLDRSFRLCPDRDCHDIVKETYTMAKEHHGTLYDEETGIRATLHRIELCLTKKVDKVGIRNAIYAFLTILVAVVVVFAWTWKYAGDVPDLKVWAQENRQLIQENKERISVSESQTKNVQDDIDELKKGQDKIGQKIDKILERLPNVSQRP
jgi:hypothetical protein